MEISPKNSLKKDLDKENQVFIEKIKKDLLGIKSNLNNLGKFYASNGFTSINIFFQNVNAFINLIEVNLNKLKESETKEVKKNLLGKITSNILKQKQKDKKFKESFFDQNIKLEILEIKKITKVINRIRWLLNSLSESIKNILKKFNDLMKKDKQVLEINFPKIQEYTKGKIKVTIQDFLNILKSVFNKQKTAQDKDKAAWKNLINFMKEFNISLDTNSNEYEKINFNDNGIKILAQQMFMMNIKKLNIILNGNTNSQKIFSTLMININKTIENFSLKMINLNKQDKKPTGSNLDKIRNDLILKIKDLKNKDLENKLTDMLDNKKYEDIMKLLGQNLKDKFKEKYEEKFNYIKDIVSKWIKTPSQAPTK